MRKTIKVLALMLLSLGIAHNADAQWGKLLNEAGKAMNNKSSSSKTKPSTNNSDNGNKTSSTSDPNRKKSSYELQEEKMNQRYEQQRLADEEKKRKEEAERQAKEEQKKAEEAERDRKEALIPEQNFYEYNHRIASTVTANSSYPDLARAYMYYARCFEFGRKDPENMAPLDLYILEMDHARDVFKWVEEMDDKLFEQIMDTVSRKPVKRDWPTKWSDYTVMDDFMDQFKLGRAKPFDYWNMIVKLAVQNEGVPPFYNDIDGYITGTLKQMDECVSNEAKMYFMQDLLKNREHEIVMMGQIHPSDENIHTALIQEYLDKFPKDFLAKYDLPALRNAEQLHKARLEQMRSEVKPMPKIPASRDAVHEKEAMERLKSQRADVKIKMCCIPSDASAPWKIVKDQYDINEYRFKEGFIIAEDPFNPGLNMIFRLTCSQKYILYGKELDPNITLDAVFGINDPMYSNNSWYYVNYK
ncbi:MAG: hypothetical protein MJZ66_09730 [Bacteroidales bacterium]|nr:hypothetical protein [Bacteroidales bacterium]